MDKEQIKFRLLPYIKVIRQEQGEEAKIQARIAWFEWAMSCKN